MQVFFVFVAIVGLIILAYGVYSYVEEEYERASFSFVLAVLMIATGILSFLHLNKEAYATNFEEGYYQIDTKQAIVSSNDEVDSFALALKNKGTNTFKLKRNKGKIATEFVCIIEEAKKDITFYLDPYDVKELVEMGAIKKVTTNK